MNTDQDWLAYFALHLDEVKGIGIHQELHERGTAKEILGSLGVVYHNTITSHLAKKLELPSYGEGWGAHYDDGRWWKPGSTALRIGDWVNVVEADKSGYHMTRLGFQYWAAAGRLVNAPPALAVNDTTFNRLVLVDGCHRTLLRVLAGLPIELVIWESRFAHMIIFPSHFVNHAIKALAPRNQV